MVLELIIIGGAVLAAGGAFGKNVIMKEETTTLIVQQSSTKDGEYKTIGEAIAAAGEGDTIEIHPGTYKENLILGDTKSVKIKKSKAQSGSVEIVGDAEKGPTITISGGCSFIHGLSIKMEYTKPPDVKKGFVEAEDPPNEATGVPVIRVTRGEPILENLDIESDERASFCLIEISGESTNPQLHSIKIAQKSLVGLFFKNKAQGKVENCQVSGQFVGALIKGEANPVFVNSQFSKNVEFGVVCEEKGKGSFEGCQIFENEQANVLIRTEANPTLTSCEIRFGKSHGVLLAPTGLGEFQNCVISSNDGCGVLVRSKGNAKMTKCQISLNKQHGIAIQEGSTGKFTECDILGNTMEGVFISSPSACFDMSERIDATLVKCKINDGAACGVRVADGANCNLDECEVSNNKDVAVLVSDAQLSAKNCKLSLSRMCAIVSGRSSEALFQDCQFYEAVRGVQVQFGKAIVQNCHVHGCSQAGVVYSDMSSGSLANTHVHENSGSGLLVENAANPDIRTCRFLKNKAAGMVFQEGALGTVNNCDIYKNSVGVGIVNQSKPTMQGCRVYDNTDVGIHMLSESTPRIEDCVISKNRAGGMAIERGAHPTIVACEISNCGGPGILARKQARGTIERCTIKGNSGQDISIASDSEEGITIKDPTADV